MTHFKPATFYILKTYFFLICWAVRVIQTKDLCCDLFLDIHL